MTGGNPVPSTCRHCAYYKPDGRRGGTCQMFDAPVQSHWKSCTLSTLPFIDLWDRVDAEFHDSKDGKEPRVRLKEKFL